LKKAIRSGSDGKIDLENVNMTAEQKYKSFLTAYAEENTAEISAIVSADG